MKDKLVVLVVLGVAAHAYAGAVLELIPDQAGPYSPGQTVSVGVWLYNEEPFGIDLRLAGLDIQGLRERLFAGGEFLTSGGTTVNRVAKFSGGAWTALDTGLPGPIFALFDKRATSLGWISPDDLESEGLEEFRRLGTAGLQAQLAGVGNLTATAFTVTTGALAVPAGAGAIAVDVAATGLDVASGRVSLTGGAVVVTAVAAGSILHFSFADDLTRLTRPANVASDLRFTQMTASPRFTSPGSLFYGKSVGEVAQLIRSGVLKVEDIPVRYVERNGKRLIVNTRSALALRRAGISPSKWRLLNRTGDTGIEREISRRLRYNGLTDEGTSTLRRTGVGRKASSLE